MLYHRQKVLITLLEEARRPVNRLELMKWAFLLRNESPSSGGPAFYGFVPYQYGPFSFCLQRDMAKLVEENLVVATDEYHWSAAPSARVPPTESQVRLDVRRIIDRFAAANDPNVVLDYVYAKFPAYTINSRRRNRPEVSRPVAPLAVYTAGYEGQSADEFLDLLVRSGIQCLADVRHNPVARRYGFHKSSLHNLCGKLGIDYVHVPELGIISDWRQELHTQADRDRLFDRYAATTLATEEAAISRIAALVEAKPTVLVCMEALPCECHRSRLAAVVAARTGLAVQHLGTAVV
jgi:uncharacterized protein (DUF488 family)